MVLWIWLVNVQKFPFLEVGESTPAPPCSQSSANYGKYFCSTQRGLNKKCFIIYQGNDLKCIRITEAEGLVGFGTNSEQQNKWTQK